MGGGLPHWHICRRNQIHLLQYLLTQNPSTCLNPHHLTHTASIVFIDDAGCAGASGLGQELQRSHWAFGPNRNSSAVIHEGCETLCSSPPTYQAAEATRGALAFNQTLRLTCNQGYEDARDPTSSRGALALTCSHGCNYTGEQACRPAISAHLLRQRTHRRLIVVRCHARQQYTVFCCKAHVHFLSFQERA